MLTFEPDVIVYRTVSGVQCFDPEVIVWMRFSRNSFPRARELDRRVSMDWKVTATSNEVQHEAYLTRLLV